MREELPSVRQRADTAEDGEFAHCDAQDLCSRLKAGLPRVKCYVPSEEDEEYVAALKVAMREELPSVRQRADTAEDGEFAHCDAQDLCSRLKAGLPRVKCYAPSEEDEEYVAALK